ncbi:hypothetical protein N0V90_003101 [Kalmusia sp. IMI 367209]|nr:hypothetical protein N0V90_003101 [Kalmusia sp. IMI 367209]
MKIYAAIGALVTFVQANLDVITLNTKSDNYITEATATLVLGKTPNPRTGDAALWSAIMMDKNDFLQGVTQNSPEEYDKLNASTQLWDQNVYIDGKLVSTVNTSWEDISIVLNKADTSFKHSGNWQYGASGGVMSTPDSGKTWNFTTLSIPETVPR